MDFPFRTNCCGGSLMFTLKGQAEKLSSMIIHSILKTDANLIVTPCGLCQLNLEIARKRICREISDHRFLPILNLGQLLGLAFDIDTRTLSVNRKKYVAKQGSFQIITSQMKS